MKGLHFQAKKMVNVVFAAVISIIVNDRRLLVSLMIRRWRKDANKLISFDRELITQFVLFFSPWPMKNFFN